MYDGLKNTYHYDKDTARKDFTDKGPTYSYPDHCWDFEFKDFLNRLNKAGFSADVLKLKSNCGRFKTIANNDAIGMSMGLNYQDIVFLCAKNL